LEKLMGLCDVAHGTRIADFPARNCNGSFFSLPRACCFVAIESSRFLPRQRISLALPPALYDCNKNPAEADVTTTTLLGNVVSSYPKLKPNKSLLATNQTKSNQINSIQYDMSSNSINMETGEAVGNGGRSPRFTLWVAFLVFASITMGSAVEVVRRSPLKGK
jgi:hypothetical protein